MKFYDREEEQELLENIRAASLQESQMTVFVWAEAYWQNPIGIAMYRRKFDSLFLCCT